LIILEYLLGGQYIFGEIVVHETAYSFLCQFEYLCIVLDCLLEYLIEIFLVSFIDIFGFGRKFLF
jgi:hypothetical protein